MKTVTITGRIGRDAETRNTNSTTVTGFSVAVDDGWGDNKTTLWFDCSMWGTRGEKLAQHLTKGTIVSVSGDLGNREYNGKTYMTVRVNELSMFGGGKRDASQQASQPPAQSGGYGGQGPSKDYGSLDDTDSIPF